METNSVSWGWIKKLRELLEAEEHDEKVERHKKLIGKYFIQIGSHSEKLISCKFFYRLDEKPLKTYSLNVTYWLDEDGSVMEEYCKIDTENTDNFDNFNKDEDRYFKYKEITKEIFEKHLVIVEEKLKQIKSVWNHKLSL